MSGPSFKISSLRSISGGGALRAKFDLEIADVGRFDGCRYFEPQNGKAPWVAPASFQRNGKWFNTGRFERELSAAIATEVAQLLEREARCAG